MSELLKKRFSIGLSMKLSLAEFEKILAKYHEYIYEVYFAPPFGIMFQTRAAEHKYQQPSKETFLKFLHMIRIVKQYGVELNLVLNTNQIKENNVIQAFDDITSHIPIDRVTTLGKFASLLKNKSPALPLVCSYNQGVKSIKDIHAIPNIKSFETVVLGNSTLRDFSLFSSIKENGYKVKLLLNNGCNFDCASFCAHGSDCSGMFASTLERNNDDYNYLYALQSIMPWEFHKFYLGNDLIDLFKISSRPSSYTYLEGCLRSYIENDNAVFLFGKESPYTFWARLTNLLQYNKYFNYDKITQYKKQIWAESLKNNSQSQKHI
jgi:hypothetical protein